MWYSLSLENDVLSHYVRNYPKISVLKRYDEQDVINSNRIYTIVQFIYTVKQLYHSFVFGL